MLEAFNNMYVYVVTSYPSLKSAWFVSILAIGASFVVGHMWPRPVRLILLLALIGRFEVTILRHVDASWTEIKHVVPFVIGTPLCLGALVGFLRGWFIP